MTGTTIPHITVSITEPIDINDVTQGDLIGTGVFDVLLSTMTEHLNVQYDKRRITGTEFATLYLGAYQATLQQAIALTLAKETQAYEIQNLQWEAKIKEAQYNLAEKQLEIAKYEVNTKAPAEVAGITKQNTLLDGQATLQTKEGTLKDLEASLATAKIAGETANTASTSKQTELYERKRLTEVAQLDGTGILTGSVLHTQKLLLEAQTLGLEKDAKQKVAKLMLDTWATRSTIIDSADVTPTNKLRDDEIGLVVTNLCASVGVTV